MSHVLGDILRAYHNNVSLEGLLGLLLQSGAATEIAQHVRTSGIPQEISGLLERCFQALRRGNVTATVDAGENGEEYCSPKRLACATGALFKAGIDLLSGEEGGSVDNPLAAFPDILLDHMDLLNFQQLAALLSDVSRGVEGGCPGTPMLLQLLPKAATQLLREASPEDEAEEDIPGLGVQGGGVSSTAATRHVDTALHRIIHADWVSARGGIFAVQIMEALRDVPMTPPQLHSLICKCLSVCSSIGGSDPAALPALLRQLMRLAGRGHRSLVLRGIMTLFERLELQNQQLGSAREGHKEGGTVGGPSQVIQNVEGTALVIMADAFKYDSALAEELLRSVRSSSLPPSPFCLLLLFTLFRQHKLDSQVVALLKSLVTAAFEWDVTRSCSAWLSSLPQLPRPSGHQLQTALLRAVRYSGVGGEVVVPGILALGAALMAGCPPGEALALVRSNDLVLAEALAATSVRRAQKRQQQQPPQLPPQLSPPRARGSAALQGALLGIQLLQAAFEVHREARLDVLRLCQQALGGAVGGGAAAGLGGGALSGSGSGSGGGAGSDLALPVVLLLGNLAARHPALLCEHTARLKDAFQGFLLLPAPVALGLLLGLWPLARSRRDLGDHLVMTLRKVMFAREAASRLVAVRGFLFILLQQLRVAAGGAAAEDDEQLVAAVATAAAAGPSFSQASCSQSSLSQMQALASGAGVSLQHELQGFLRRALGQQAAVRGALYEGLSEILLVDPGSRDVVLELVVPQFYRYVAEGAAMPPLHCRLLVGGGSSSSDSVVLLEPLPALLACVRRLVALCRDPGLGGDCGGGAQRWGHPGLFTDEDDAVEDVVVMADEDTQEGDVKGPGQSMDLAVKVLLRTWDSFVRRLLRCEAEHFDLNCSSDLNPATASGAARQLQASCLLGAVEVVMEELVGIATGPHGASTAVRSGARLTRAFDLHCRVYDLAREARAHGAPRGKQAAVEARTGSGGDGSTGAAATAPGTAPQGPGGDVGGGGAKRLREQCANLVPVDQRSPAMSPGCLGKLCSGILQDALVTELCGVVETEGEAGPSAHTRLARSPVFQAFVLRSCLNSLRAAATTANVAARSDALSDALMACAARRLPRAAEVAALGQGQSGACGGGGGFSHRGDGPDVVWKPLARPLMLLCQAVLISWGGPAKRPTALRRGPGSTGVAGGPAAVAAAAAARREAAASDSLAGLAVSCLRELMAATADVGGLEAVSWVLRGLPIHSQDSQAQVDERHLSAAEAEAEAVSARLPHFSDMLIRLMSTCSFKEAALLVEVVVAVAQSLPLQLQKAVSDECLELMQQEEPQVTHPGLVRALVAAHVTLRGQDDVAALKAVALHVQEVVGRAESGTQLQEEQEVSAPASLHEGTAQLAEVEVLLLLERLVAQGEELMEAVAAALRGNWGEAVAGAAVGGGASGAAGSSTSGGAGLVGLSTRHLSQLVDALCMRLGAVVDVLQVVVQTKLGYPLVLELQVAALIRSYRLLAALAKSHLPTKGSATAGSGFTAVAPPRPPGRCFQQLVAQVHRDLTPPVYEAVGADLGPAVEGGLAGGEDVGGAGKLSRAKLKRDAKAYSHLVHAIEEWEKHLLALEKAFKAQGVNLMRGAKRSTNRDFKIVVPSLGMGAPRGGGGVDNRRP